MTEYPKFMLWVRKKAFEVSNRKTIEQIVDEQMVDDNLKIEIYNDGEWVGFDDRKTLD